MMYRPYDKPRRRFPIIVVLAVVLLAGVATAIARSYKRWESQPPEVVLNRDFKALGKQPVLAALVRDSGTGLKHVTIRLKQKDQEVVLADETLNKEGAKTYDIGNLINEKYKVQDGPATLSITATDSSLRNFFKGSSTELTKDFAFHTHPPKLEVLEGQHYINQGGSECIVYRVSPEVEQSGVQVGEHFFPGYPVPGASDKNLRFALFALEYD